MLGTAGLGAVAFALVWFVVIPYPWTLRARNPERTSLMGQRVREATDSGHVLEIRQVWVPLDQISPNLVRAVQVAEDYRFREHRGVDWVSLAEEVKWTGDDSFSWRSGDDRRALRAALSYVRANRDEIRGRSTLTQQLAKNLYWGADRSFVRKVLEFVVAGRLERALGKDRILELYLNVAEWGPGIFGAEAAARHYFDRPASRLTLDQAAALAGTLPHPLTSNPAYRPGRMQWRKELILARLDPTSGLPPAPMPLPDPTFELPLPDLKGIPAGDATPAGDSLAPFDTSRVEDSARVVPDKGLGVPDTAGVLPGTPRDTVMPGGGPAPRA